MTLVKSLHVVAPTLSVLLDSEYTDLQVQSPTGTEVGNLNKSENLSTSVTATSYELPDISVCLVV